MKVHEAYHMGAMFRASIYLRYVSMCDDTEFLRKASKQHMTSEKKEEREKKKRKDARRWRDRSMERQV